MLRHLLSFVLVSVENFSVTCLIHFEIDLDRIFDVAVLLNPDLNRVMYANCTSCMADRTPPTQY